MKKRIISLLLAVIMVLGMMPFAMAEEVTAGQTKLEPIVMDFMGFAAEAAEQDFWANLLNNNVAGAKTLGAASHGSENTAEVKAAVAAMESWMDGRYNWDIPNMTDTYKAGGHFNHAWGGDWLYLDPASEYFGLRYYTAFPANGGGESRLELTVDVPEGGAGKYIMTVDGYQEAAFGSAVPSYTGADQGGAKVTTFINGEEYGTFHQTTGNDSGEIFSTENVGVVELKEGTNDIIFWTIADRNGGPWAGRCALNLRNIKFEPIDHSDYVLDFYDIRAIAEEPFWADLRATDVDTVKSIGCLSGVSPEASYTAALGELDTWLDENLNWDIPDLLDAAPTGGHYNHPYGQRRLYVDSVNDYYGLRLDTSYPGNGSGESKFTLTFDVPAGVAGPRKMVIETYNEAVTSIVPATEGMKGGAVASFSLNGEQVVDHGSFFAAEDGVGTIETDVIDLQPGENTILIEINSNRNGVVQLDGSGRCALNLRNIKFVFVCDHADAQMVYESNRDRTHVQSNVCDCGETLSTETVACADGDDADTKCDGCGFELKQRGPSTSEFAEDSIVIDFMDFAYEAMQQPWWNDLYPASKAEGVRGIGLPNGDKDSRTSEYEAAIYAVSDWMEENCNWYLVGLTDGPNPYYHEWGGRQVFVDSVNEYYGIRFYTHVPANTGSNISKLELQVNVPEGLAGTYNMNVEGFYEAVSSIVPMATVFDQGGAKAVVSINGEEIGTIHQSKGDAGIDEVVVDELGEVTLEEGYNSIVFNVIGDRNSVAAAGRCALNLRNIEFRLVELTPSEPECDHANTTEETVSNGDKTHTTTVTCECGEVVSEEIIDCADEDKDCLCDVCGATIKEITKISVVGANMTLGNDLKMNFMINKADMKEGYVAYVSQAGAEPVQLELWSYNAAYYAASYSVAAKEMTDVLSVEIYDADGYLVSEPFTRTVKQYAMTLLNNASQKASLKSVIVDMLNYGTEAQKYFGHNEDAYANAEVTAEQQETYATKEVECVNNQQGGTNFVGANLSLEDSILLNVFFRGITNGDLTGVTATVSFTDYLGNEVTANAEIGTQGSAMVKVVVNQIVLADAKRPVTVTVYKDGAELGSGIESVESYIARNLTNADTGALNMAIMKFSASAYNHLGGTN